MNVKTFKANIEKLTGETRQNKIADALNISVSKISKWFSGDLLPTTNDLLNISKTYHCSIDWLIGNEYEGKEELLSEYDICKFLMKLDDELIIHIELKEMVEEVSFWDDENEIFIEKKYKENIPIIYMCNTESAAQIINRTETNYTWCTEYCDRCHASIQRNLGSILNCNKAVNDFLIKYIQMKNVLQKDLISNTVFNDIINSYLDKLSKGFIDLFPYDDPYKHYIYDDEIDDLPFDDGRPEKWSEETIKIFEESQKEFYKIENVLKNFTSKNNIVFLDEEDTDTSKK